MQYTTLLYSYGHVETDRASYIDSAAAAAVCFYSVSNLTFFSFISYCSSGAAACCPHYRAGGHPERARENYRGKNPRVYLLIGLAGLASRFFC